MMLVGEQRDREGIAETVRMAIHDSGIGEKLSAARGARGPSSFRAWSIRPVENNSRLVAASA